MLVLFHLSVQLKLTPGHFGGFEISTEVVATCCFLALQTAGGFHDVEKGKSQPGLACQPAPLSSHLRSFL